MPLSVNYRHSEVFSILGMQLQEARLKPENRRNPRVVQRQNIQRLMTTYKSSEQNEDAMPNMSADMMDSTNDQTG